MKKYKYRYDYHLVSPKLREIIDLRDFRSDIKNAVKSVTDGTSITFKRYKAKEKEKKRPIGHRTSPPNETLVCEKYYSVYSDYRLSRGFFVMVGTEIANTSDLGKHVIHYDYNVDDEYETADHSGQLFIRKQTIIRFEATRVTRVTRV